MTDAKPMTAEERLRRALYGQTIKLTSWDDLHREIEDAERAAEARGREAGLEEAAKIAQYCYSGDAANRIRALKSKPATTAPHAAEAGTDLLTTASQPSSSPTLDDLRAINRTQAELAERLAAVERTEDQLRTIVREEVRRLDDIRHLNFDKPAADLQALRDRVVEAARAHAMWLKSVENTSYPFVQTSRQLINTADALDAAEKGKEKK